MTRPPRVGSPGSPTVGPPGGRPPLRSAGLWRWLDGTGLERFELLGDRGGWRLRGTLVAAGERGPTEASYEVVCDEGWRTRAATVRLRDDAGERAVDLAAGGGLWIVNGREQPALAGCVDVDLAWSPSSNTLPIRRLSLPVGGASGPLVMAWVRFPELSVEPLPQEYARLAERRWRFTSDGGAFTAALEVDDAGVVVDYESLWRRVG